MSEIPGQIVRTDSAGLILSRFVGRWFPTRRPRARSLSHYQTNRVGSNGRRYLRTDVCVTLALAVMFSHVTYRQKSVSDAKPL